MPIRDALRRLLHGDPPAPTAPSAAAAPPASSAPPPPSPGRRQTPATDAGAGARGEAHTLALYKYDACPFCRRVMAVISQLGLEDRIEYRDTRMDPKWRADLVQRTGMTQVPCLLIDGEPLLESADIIDWLREHYA